MHNLNIKKYPLAINQWESSIPECCALGMIIFYMGFWIMQRDTGFVMTASDLHPEETKLTTIEVEVLELWTRTVTSIPTTSPATGLEKTVLFLNMSPATLPIQRYNTSQSKRYFLLSEDVMLRLVVSGHKVTSFSHVMENVKQKDVKVYLLLTERLSSGCPENRWTCTTRREEQVSCKYWWRCVFPSFPYGSG